PSRSPTYTYPLRMSAFDARRLNPTASSGRPARARGITSVRSTATSPYRLRPTSPTHRARRPAATVDCIQATTEGRDKQAIRGGYGRAAARPGTAPGPAAGGRPIRTRRVDLVRTGRSVALGLRPLGRHGDDRRGEAPVRHLEHGDVGQELDRLSAELPLQHLGVDLGDLDLAEPEGEEARALVHALFEVDVVVEHDRRAARLAFGGVKVVLALVGALDDDQHHVPPRARRALVRGDTHADAFNRVGDGEGAGGEALLEVLLGHAVRRERAGDGSAEREAQTPR